MNLTAILNTETCKPSIDNLEPLRAFKCERRKFTKERKGAGEHYHNKDKKFKHDSHWTHNKELAEDLIAEENIIEENDDSVTKGKNHLDHLNKVVDLETLKNICELVNIPFRAFWSEENDFIMKRNTGQKKTSELQIYFSRLVEYCNIVDYSIKYSAILLDFQLTSFPVGILQQNEMGIGGRFSVIVFKVAQKICFFHGGSQTNLALEKTVRKLLSLTFCNVGCRVPYINRNSKFNFVPIYSELVRGKTSVLIDPLCAFQNHHTTSQPVLVCI